MGVISNLIVNIVKQFRNFMKPYIKGLKLFSFLFIIIVSTFIFIRKKDRLSLNIEEKIKNNLVVDKNYLAVENSPIRKLSKTDKQKLNILSNIKTCDLADIYILDHKFRINDTLFLVQVFVDKENNVKALDKPIKFGYNK